eukprot:984485-Pyramimonas_sp.AAC.1
MYLRLLDTRSSIFRNTFRDAGGFASNMQVRLGSATTTDCAHAPARLCDCVDVCVNCDHARAPVRLCDCVTV